MKKYLLLSYCLVTTIIVVIGFKTFVWPKIHNKLTKHYNVIMFGDSLTEGWNEESSLSKSNCKISGNPGFTTSHFIWVINDQVLKYHPDTCYILGGVNDVGVGIPLARTFKNYKTIIDTLKKTHIVPIVQSTIFTLKSDADNNKIDSLNNFLITLCKQEDIRFIDLNKKMSINKKLNKNFSKDLVHLNTLGYQTWAAIIN